MAKVFLPCNMVRLLPFDQAGIVHPINCRLSCSDGDVMYDENLGKHHLGKYRLLRELGQGGFATVYLAVHVLLEMPVAIKVLRQPLASAHHAQFLDEARMLARLEHPAIIRLRDFDIEDEIPFLVLDFAAGGTFRQHCPSGHRLSLEQVLPLVEQLAAGLDYAASQGVVHRDIKPENILVRQRRVVLSDFGIATMKNLTAIPEQAAGTWSYVAPEQIQGVSLPACDQYSLAVCVYEWLSGAPPFTAEEKAELLEQHRSATPPSLCAQVPSLSPAIDEVVLRALAKKPEDRFPTVGAFAAALKLASVPPEKPAVLALPPQMQASGEGKRPLPEQVRKPEATIWNVPYPRNPFFTGRQETLQQLHRLLRSDESEVLIALIGLAGCGKTQVAIEYAYRHSELWASLFFFRAETRETLQADVWALAYELELDSPDAVRAWFGAHSNWLVILDNIEDLTLVHDYFPSHGQFLLTTRTQMMGRVSALVSVEEMFPEDAVPFLLHRSRMMALDAQDTSVPPPVWQQAKEIAQLLDGLPLALDQAGAYIEETGCSLSDYLAHYQTRGRLLLLARRGQGERRDHPEPVATSWSLSFERVALANPAAADLLHFCAFLSPDAIPEEVVQTFFEPLTLGGALYTLTTFSLVQRDPALQTLHIHRLVQQVLRGALSAGERRRWIQHVIRALLHVFPQTEGQDQVLLRAQRLMPHIEALLTILEEECLALEEAGQLFNAAGFYATRQANYALAEQLLHTALGQRTVVLGAGHPDVSESLNDLGFLYYTRGDLVQAERFFRQALASQRRRGDSPEHLAVTLNNVASLCRKQSKWTEAEHLFREALAIWQGSAANSHAARVLNNLALLYQDQGLLEEAEACLRQALAIWSRMSGPVPDRARTLNNLAKLCREQKRYEEAEALFLQAQKVQEQVLLPDHPDCAETLREMAALYQLLQRYEEAEFALLFALEIFEQALGSGHHKVKETLASYRALLAQQGRALPQRFSSWEI